MSNYRFAESDQPIQPSEALRDPARGGTTAKRYHRRTCGFEGTGRMAASLHTAGPQGPCRAPAVKECE